jgi:hypothetical protein
MTNPGSFQGEQAAYLFRFGSGAVKHWWTRHQAVAAISFPMGSESLLVSNVMGSTTVLTTIL